MTIQLPPPDDSALPLRAPDKRPRAAIAVWALVSSIVLMIVALFTGLVWVLLLPAAILGVIALVRIRPQTARGQGMAIVSLVIAVLAGSCQFMVARTIFEGVEHLGAGILAAASGADEEKLDAWLTEEAKENGEAERIRARLAEVVERMGTYQREIFSGTKLLGVLPLGSHPSDAEHVGGEGEDAHRARPGGLWLDAQFERGVVHVELILSTDAAQQLQNEEFEKGQALPILDEVRFYLPPAPEADDR